MPPEPPTTKTCLPLKLSSFISQHPVVVGCLTCVQEPCQPSQSATSLGVSSMSDFKLLSRSVKGLTVLITGAASGMGRATARVFALEGANVAVTDFNADGAKAIADEILAGGRTAKAWRLDVARSEEIETVVA